MKNNKYTLIRDSFDSYTKEREHVLYSGKLLKKDRSVLHFAFKVEDGISRINISYESEVCHIKQVYSDSVSEMDLSLKKKLKYYLKLNSGYTLNFYTEASFIKIDEFEIKLKYNLYDDKSNLISMNEVSIIGEDGIC